MPDAHGLLKPRSGEIESARLEGSDCNWASQRRATNARTKNQNRGGNPNRTGTGSQEAIAFPYQHRNGPQKRDAEEPSLFRYGIVFLQLENKERKCWVPKGVAFLHGNETHSRVSFYFRPFFVRVVVLKLYTIIT